MLETGIKGKKSVRVTEGNSAPAVGSGTAAVFATPAMIALMEGCAYESVQPYLEEDSATVGVALDVRHLAATPQGMDVHCESELIGIDGRTLTFRVAAYDGCGVIGEGTHKRVIVDAAGFQKKADAKRKEAAHE